MKIFLLLILSSTAFADCKLGIPEREVARFLAPPVVGHYLKCEDYPQEQCHCVENIDPWSAELVDEVVDGSPIYSKHDVSSCSDQADCDSKFVSLVCADNANEKIKNYDQMEVYCAHLEGYEQVLTGKKALAVSQVKRAAREASVAAQKQREEDIQVALKEASKGQRVMALFRVLNKKKNLTGLQKKALLSDTNIKSIMDALDAGSLDVAGSLINAYVADGVLVTEQDKQTLLQELSN